MIRGVTMHKLIQRKPISMDIWTSTEIAVTLHEVSSEPRSNH